MPTARTTSVVKQPPSEGQLTGYVGNEQQFWIKHHQRFRANILAIGRGNTTEAVNVEEYRQAADRLRNLLEYDFSDSRETMSVLDLGYGHGHHARVCHELGFGDYLGLDFGSSIHPDLGSRYCFQRMDITQVNLNLGRKFSLVLVIDVAYHIVRPDRFANLINNIRRHASDKVYITSLFVHRVIPPYCRHRPLSAFKDIGRHLGTVSWRDNRLARFGVNT